MAKRTAQTAPSGAMVNDNPLAATAPSSLPRRAIAANAPADGHTTSLALMPLPLLLAVLVDATTTSRQLLLLLLLVLFLGGEERVVVAAVAAARPFLVRTIEVGWSCRAIILFCSCSCSCSCS